MKPEAQRIAIAEACGWLREYANVPTWNASLNSYKGGYEPVRTMLFRREKKCFLAENLPDYLTDLNAMHDAETQMKNGDWTRYCQYLAEYGGGTVRFVSVHATAQNRAKAFLRTLKLWKD